MDMVHTGRPPFYLTVDQQYVVLCACPPRGDLARLGLLSVACAYRAHGVFVSTRVCVCVCVCAHSGACQE